VLELLPLPLLTPLGREARRACRAESVVCRWSSTREVCTNRVADQVACVQQKLHAFRTYCYSYASSRESLLSPPQLTCEVDVVIVTPPVDGLDDVGFDPC
jgi:hypothetical protein